MQQRRRLHSHIVAIIITLIIIFGLPRLPAILGSGLPGWFSLFWLLLAVLALLAHVQRAQLFRRQHGEQVEQEKRYRRRSEM